MAHSDDTVKNRLVEDVPTRELRPSRPLSPGEDEATQDMRPLTASESALTTHPSLEGMAIDAEVTQAGQPPLAAMDTTGSARSRSLHTTAARGVSGGLVASTEALRTQEITRTRSFLVLIIMCSLASGSVLLFIGGDAVAKTVAGTGLGIGALTCGFMLWRIRDDRAFTPGLLGTVSYTIVLASYPAIYFWGVFSPAPAIMIMGLAFMGLGASLRASFATYLLCAGLQGTASVLILAEVIPDRGMYTAGSMGLRENAVTQALLQGLLLGSFAIARLTRKASLESLVRLERAARAVALREALLLEAKQELDRALQVEGPGRYTDQVVGSFRLGHVLGRGGMGEVYEAQHVETEVLAAVKLLHLRALNDQRQVARFLREADIASRLSSAHVATVYETGRAGQVPYLAMERLSGHDLAHHLRTRRRLAVEQVVDLLRQVGKGLEEAHQAGIVHRDLKPQNLFLAETRDSGTVWKILDFGVSKLAESTGTLTDGSLVGTPAYMAPEQALGEPVDQRADIYALAVVAYRALTGSPAYLGKDIPVVLMQVAYATPRRPSSLVDLPEDVDRVLALGLCKEPAGRFDSAGELADALEAAASSELADDLRLRADRLLARRPWGYQP